MAIQSRVTLKSLFENGDTPEGDNYADWIDSYLHLTDTSAQSIDSPVIFNNAVKVATVSAENVVVSGEVFFSTAIGVDTQVDTLFVSAVASVATLFADTATATRLVAGSAAVSSISMNSVSFLVETTAAASAGPGGAVPSSAAGFIEVLVSGSAFVMPYFVREV